MKAYCPIPDTEIQTDTDILTELTELFEPYGVSAAGFAIDFDSASFNIKLADRYLVFRTEMPDLSDWLFYEESPAVLNQGWVQARDDYEPRRNYPYDVSEAWQRLLYYRAERMFALIATELAKIDGAGTTLDTLFPSFVIRTDGQYQLDRRAG